MHLLRTALPLALLSPLLLLADAVKDREGAVRQDKAKLESSERWNYNDVAKGFAEGQKTGKPVLVVLRCVPCLACMGLDTGVLMEGEELKPLLDQFVCVRLINANALDLARFQFDYDLSFSILCFNADGTVYGRYGSWKAQKDSQESALEGLRKALAGALEIHRGYPANKASLASKQPGPTPFAKPVDIPSLAEKYTAQLNWEGKVVQSCVHCHMIGNALQAWHRKEKKPMPESLIYPFPEPETLGLTLDGLTIARVTAVAPGSLAAKAGIQAGDDLTAAAGAPLISQADLAWALHTAPDQGTLSLSYRRGDKEQSVTLDLPAQWRRKSDVTLRGTVWAERGMALGGLRLEPAPDAAGLKLRVKGVGQYGIHATAKKAGFKEGDLLLEFDSATQPLTEGELLGLLLSNRQEGEKVNVKVQRGNETLTLQLPMQ